MRFDKNSHYWNMALNILLSLGFKPLEKRLAEVRYSKEVVKKAKDVFDSLELDNKPVIAINPFVAWPTRTWDKDNFVKLIEILHKNYNIILYGGPDAKKTEQYILNKLNKKGIKIKSVIGKLNLKESIYFLKFVDLFVTGDSGPMHFAFLMKTPTLALFGPVNPLHRLPIDFKKYKIFDYLWYCDYKPCKSLYNYEFEYTNKEMEGLKAIPVRDVIKKIEHFFNSNKRFY
jgi:ADP-heptose:LPS heptosyltransferase